MTKLYEAALTKGYSKITYLRYQHLILGPIVITSGTAGPPGKKNQETAIKYKFI